MFFCLNWLSYFVWLQRLNAMYLMARHISCSFMLKSRSTCLWSHFCGLDASVGQHRAAEWSTVAWFQEISETQVLKSVSQSVRWFILIICHNVGNESQWKTCKLLWQLTVFNRISLRLSMFCFHNVCLVSAVICCFSLFLLMCISAVMVQRRRNAFALWFHLWFEEAEVCLAKHRLSYIFFIVAKSNSPLMSFPFWMICQLCWENNEDNAVEEKKKSYMSVT